MSETKALDIKNLGASAVEVLSKPKREFDGLVRRYHKQAYNIAYRLTGNHTDA